MSYLRSFAPWIAYAAISGVADWRVAAAIAVVVATIANRDQRRRYGEVDDLATTTKWFFLGLFVLSAVRPSSPVHHFTPALALVALGAASVASLLRGRPFTLTIAKRTTTHDLWDSAVSRDANVAITTVWATSFLVTAALCVAALAAAPHLTWLWVSIEVLGFVVPVLFTRLYRERLQKRFALAA